MIVLGGIQVRIGRRQSAVRRGGGGGEGENECFDIDEEVRSCISKCVKFQDDHESIVNICSRRFVPCVS